VNGIQMIQWLQLYLVLIHYQSFLLLEKHLQPFFLEEIQVMLKVVYITNYLDSTNHNSMTTKATQYVQ